MTVGANQCIGIRNHFALLVRVRPDCLCQVFEIHLMANPCSRRHDAEIVERALTPFEELVTLHISLIFAVYVQLERTGITEFVDHDRVVDNQINGVQRINLLCVPAKSYDSVAHCG